ncbi:unnamed protein product, partial [Phaeothamnion confervicola]
IKVEKLEEDTGVRAHQVVDMEQQLLTGLRCHLTVWHPYRAFRGFLEDAGQFCKGKGRPLDAQVLTELAQAGDDLIDNVMVTRLPLVHPPAHIGLAVLLELLE